MKYHYFCPKMSMSITLAQADSTEVPGFSQGQAADSLTETTSPGTKLTGFSSGKAPAERFVSSQQHETIHIHPLPLHPRNESFGMLAAGMGIALLFFLLIKIRYRHFYSTLQSCLFSRALFTQHQRDGSLFPVGTILPAALASLIIFGVLLFLSAQKFQLSILQQTGSIFHSFLLLTGLIALVYLAKTLLVVVSGFIFKTQQLSRQYLANVLFFNILTSIVVLPLLLLSYFDPGTSIILLTLLISVLLFIFRFLRGARLALKTEKYSLYQIFLYLCALEILPIFVIFKMVSSKV